MADPEKGEPEIDDIRENHTSNRVDFEVFFREGRLDSIQHSEGGKGVFRGFFSPPTRDLKFI
jgi:hypothetical protein